MELKQRIASLGQPVWDFCNIFESFRSIEGFLHPFEGYMLYILSKTGEGDGEIVEIGSFMGLSTCWLAKGAKDAGRECVTAIDHFTGSVEHQEDGVSYSNILEKEGTTFNKFLENIRSRDLDDYVIPIVASSEDAAESWEKPIRLLFIDGDHNYESVKRDFELWSPYVIPKGIICLHDVGAKGYPGPTHFYAELMRSSSEYTQLFSAMTLQAIQRLSIR